MWQEGLLWLFRNPVRQAHGSDQLGGAVRNLSRVGDALAPLVTIPAPVHDAQTGSGRLLKLPAVAVGILEVRVPGAPVLFADIADLDASFHEFRPDPVDIGYHEQQPLRRAGRARSDSGADHDRAGRARRRQLHEPQTLTQRVVVIGVKADLVDVARFRALDIGDGDGNAVELHLHTVPFRSLPRVQLSRPRRAGTRATPSTSRAGSRVAGSPACPRRSA